MTQNTKAKQAEKFIGESHLIRKIRSDIPKVSRNDKTVLIQGPTGTGKELIANEIHLKSQRNARKFITVNCAAIPRELFESTMFGHKKGSFTGALADQKGMVEQAHGGTLFLDEIGDLQPDHQAKVLRFLNDFTFKPLGGQGEDQRADVRIISATNKDLLKETADGKFRNDLYNRICEYIIRTQPLAGRHEDIVLLANYFRSRTECDPRTKVLLYSHDFSEGNVRQLKQFVSNADDYDYVRGEILRAWASKKDVSADELLSSLIEKVKEIRKKEWEGTTPEFDFREFVNEFRVPYAALYLDGHDLDYKSIVIAYEISILKTRTDLSNHDIASRLRLGNDVISPIGFEKRFGVNLDRLSGSNFGYIFPDFISCWPNCRGIQEDPWDKYW